MTLDLELITRKKAMILEDLGKLKSFEKLSLKEYLNDFGIQLQVERLLERIIGRLLDINIHVLKEKKNLIPKDYRSSFLKMGQYGYADNDLARGLTKSVGLRNVLAHDYDEIDAKKVYESIKMGLNEVPRYLKGLEI